MIKKYFPIWICLITIMAISDSIPFITIKLVLEAVFMGGLWVIIIAIDYIRNSHNEKIVKKEFHNSDIDRRPIIEQLNEAYGNAQERRRK